MTTPAAPSFEAEWRARFERFARTYADEALISGWSDAGLRRRLNLFGALLRSLGLPESSRVLDLGCGAGTYVRLLAGLGHRAIGLDYSLPSLERARAADPEGAGAYVSGEAYQLPFGDGTFDLVVSIGVLQALAEPEAALAEIARVARPGGVVVVEGLNGRGIVTIARRLLQSLQGLSSRARAYPPPLIRRWLSERGLVLERESGLCLAPRRAPWLGRCLEAPLTERVLTGVPGLRSVASHSFLYVARKPLAVGAV
jgi:SAM-dependent methyltransferase